MTQDDGISRRDFLQGVAITLALGTTLRPLDILAATEYYPPGLNGMRGTHDGAWEVAHALAWQGKKWTEPGNQTDPDYDLVVVGGGISGLAAAWFWRQRAGHKARILVIDNHDDFGGHAKRNEFEVGGVKLIGYGGTQSIDTPSEYSEEASNLLSDLGIRVKRFYKYFDQKFYEKHKMRSGVHFDAKSYGRSLLTPQVVFGGWDGPFTGNIDAALAPYPLKPSNKAALKKLLKNPPNPLADLPMPQRIEKLRKISYETWLRQYLGVPETIAVLLRNRPTPLWGIGYDALSALEAGRLGMPGIYQTVPYDQIPTPYSGAEPYIFHFPDGNATIARLLVRDLVPGVASSTTPEDLALEHIHYDLDRAESATRIRLNATAVHVLHTVDKQWVDVTYVRRDSNTAERVRGRHVILACYNRVIPYLMPELPPKQVEAIRTAVKVPLVYINVALRNWHAFKKAGISGAYSPHGFAQDWSLDFPVSLPGYEFSHDPSKPIVLHMCHVPAAPGSGLDEREQHKAGRQKILEMTFADFEREIRAQLRDALGPHGFNDKRDIAAITVNRWPHGYAYEYNELYDPVEWNPTNGPHVLGRKKVGRISIANTDSEAHAYTNAAIDAAWRAVGEQSA